MADESPSLDSLIGDRARDENGRFKSVTPTEEPKVAVTPPPVAKAEAAPVVIPPVVATPPVVTPPVAPPVTPPIDAEKEGYKKAMQSEREKRQAAEARLRELDKPKVKPDFWADPEARMTMEREELQETMFVERCNLTADIARQRYKNYDEMQAAFLEAAEADPSLFARLRAERNPAEFAYKHGVLHRELGSVNGDMTAYRAKIRAEVEAEFAAKQGVVPVVVPTSLNADTSPTAATEVYAGPPPLKSLLRINDRRR